MFKQPMICLALGIVEGPCNLAAVNAAGCVDLFDRQLKSRLHVFAEEGPWSRDREDGADAQRFVRCPSGAKPL